MIKYLLALSTFVLCSITLLISCFGFKLFKKSEKLKNKDSWLKVERIVTIVITALAIALFFVRFMCYDDIQWVYGWEKYIKFGEIPQSKVAATFGELCLWLIVPANLALFMRTFSKEKTASWFVKFISLPVIVITLICLKQTEINMIGEVHKSLSEFRLVEIMFPLELGTTLSLATYYFIKDLKVRIAKPEYHYVGIMAIVSSFFAIPPFLPMFFFGLGKPGLFPYDLSQTHRIVIYLFFIVLPLLLYFFLREKGPLKIRYSLTFISLAAMFAFMYANKFSKFDEPWNYPWHLCNTAMFILPLCLIFKPKRLFYFTYFINVFGALMATLMPNYGSTDLMFNPDVIRFIMNHTIAFWMPLLMVALKVYERPKLKQYYYSILWLLVYFVLTLGLNVYFNRIDVTTGLPQHSTDFFFTYTDKIPDKLGAFGTKVYNHNYQFEYKGYIYTLRPLFQSLYYVGYVLFGFGMWFVYQLGFDISDAHYQLHLKLKGIKQDRIALESVLQGRSIEEPMDKDAGIKLELDHFSKKYGSNKHYSVHDVSFEVHAGEVFGFLGPNGAGKSTIIKSLVGIQPITEGRMRVCGYDVQSQPVQSKANIGFVPDHYALYEKLTGREYINYIADIFQVSKEDREERISRYVKLFELEGSIDNKIKTYSHGMKQKVTIISALVHNPKVWILDEPLTGLDPTSIYQVKQCMLKHAQEGNIVFFSSHLIDVVEKLCDRVGIIKHGELQAVDTIANIEKHHKSLEHFYLEIIGDNTTKVD